MSWLRLAAKEIDDSYYTMGMCGAYAIALSRLLGGKPLAAVRGYYPEEPHEDGSRSFEDAHVVVVLGPDRYADVRGVRSASELLSAALFSPGTKDAEVVSTTPQDVEYVWAISDEDVAEAEAFIREMGIPDGVA